MAEEVLQERGFSFLENWTGFSVGYRHRLFSRDRLHPNREGAALLGEKMGKTLEGFFKLGGGGRDQRK